jgi:hypothetical protein
MTTRQSGGVRAAEVLVDTGVWSWFLGRNLRPLGREQQEFVAGLKELILHNRARLLGAIRQEVLSGISDEAQYDLLRTRLHSFPDVVLERQDYEEAARVSNICRRSGLSGGAIDFLICAVALRRDWAVFSTDSDFRLFAGLLPLRLYSPRQKPGTRPK